MSVHLCSWRKKFGTIAAGALIAATATFGMSGAAHAAQPAPDQPTIVGGEVVDKAPSWAVAIGDTGDDMWCSGSLVGSRWVLTAEHCTKAKVARIGSKDVTSGGTLVDITSTVAHPKYDFRLYELKSAVDNKPIGLAKSSPSPGDEATLYGYGQTCIVYGCGDMSRLRSLETEIAPDSDCEGIKEAGEVCMASTMEASACYGDSGGPAIVDGRLAGVTSRGGYVCGAVGTTYGDVSAVRSWIESNIA